MAKGEAITPDDVRAAMKEIMGNTLKDTQVAAFLMGLKVRDAGGPGDPAIVAACAEVSTASTPKRCRRRPTLPPPFSQGEKENAFCCCTFVSSSPHNQTPLSRSSLPWCGKVYCPVKIRTVAGVGSAAMRHVEHSTPNV